MRYEGDAGKASSAEDRDDPLTSLLSDYSRLQVEFQVDCTGLIEAAMEMMLKAFQLGDPIAAAEAITVAERETMIQNLIGIREDARKLRENAALPKQARPR